MGEQEGLKELGVEEEELIGGEEESEGKKSFWEGNCPSTCIEQTTVKEFSLSPLPL